MTITIRNIVVHDGTRMTDAGKDLCARVYEANTGKCWHIGQRDLSAVVLGGVSTRDSYACKKCGYIFLNGAFVLKYCEDVNPNLLHDLNAVHELEAAWFNSVDSGLQCSINSAEYANAMSYLMAGAGSRGAFMSDANEGVDYVGVNDYRECPIYAPAHVRLEALASVVQVEMADCGPSQSASCYDNEPHCPCPDITYKQESILDQWEREWRKE